MTEFPDLSRKMIARRSLLSGAVKLSGGAMLAASAPSLALAAMPASGAQERPVPGTQKATAVPTGAPSATMKFTPAFLANKIFTDLPLSFTPPSAPLIDGSSVTVGALIQTSGDILFRIFAPNAKDVRLKFSQVREGTLVLSRQANSIFEGLLTFDENHTGPMGVEVSVDGMVFLDPYLPIQWSGNRPRNFIEVPDTELDFLHIKDVPHGTVSREVYWADVLKSWERCLVYTPPGAMKSQQEYPVLYLQHGATENETTWESVGHVAHILDNLIASGKAAPMIVVMNNGMLRYNDTANGVVDDAFERMLIESCIPHIEKSYRAKSSKADRAIAGLSLGSYMACDIGFRHPELFTNIGTFTASMTHETLRMNYERPYHAVMKDARKFADHYKIYFRSTTPAEDHFADYFVADDKLCADAGIDSLPSYHRVVYPPHTTKWNSWRMGLRDFAQLLFR